MNKNEIIERLRNAKVSHLGWVSRARALIEGQAVDKEKIPVLPTDCIFGKWYYSDGKALSNLATFKEIELPHNELHKIYSNIFYLLFEKSKKTFISRLTGKYKKEQSENLKEAKKLFIVLQKMSDIILKKLDTLEKEVRTHSS